MIKSNQVAINNFVVSALRTIMRFYFSKLKTTKIGSVLTVKAAATVQDV